MSYQPRMLYLHAIYTDGQLTGCRIHTEAYPTSVDGISYQILASTVGHYDDPAAHARLWEEIGPLYAKFRTASTPPAFQKGQRTVEFAYAQWAPDRPAPQGWSGPWPGSSGRLHHRGHSVPVHAGNWICVFFLGQKILAVDVEAVCPV